MHFDDGLHRPDAEAYGVVFIETIGDAGVREQLVQSLCRGVNARYTRTPNLGCGRIGKFDAHRSDLLKFADDGIEIASSEIVAPHGQAVNEL